MRILCACSFMRLILSLTFLGVLYGPKLLVNVSHVNQPVYFRKNKVYLLILSAF